MVSNLAGAGLLPRPPPAPSGTSSLARTLWTQHRHQLLRGMPLPHTPPGLCTSTSEMVFHPITPQSSWTPGTQSFIVASWFLQPLADNSSASWFCRKGSDFRYWSPGPGVPRRGRSPVSVPGWALRGRGFSSPSWDLDTPQRQGVKKAGEALSSLEGRGLCFPRRSIHCRLSQERGRELGQERRHRGEGSFCSLSDLKKTGEKEALKDVTWEVGAQGGPAQWV